MLSQDLTMLWPTENKWAREWRSGLCCCQAEEIGFSSMESKRRDLSCIDCEEEGWACSSEQIAALACFAALNSASHECMWVECSYASGELEEPFLELLSWPMAITLLEMRYKHIVMMLLVYRFFTPLLALFKVILGAGREGRTQATLGRQKKPFSCHPGLLWVLGMQTIRSGARLEQVPLAFTLSLPPPFLRHRMLQAPTGDGSLKRNLITKHSPLICSLQMLMCCTECWLGTCSSWQQLSICPWKEEALWTSLPACLQRCIR